MPFPTVFLLVFLSGVLAAYAARSEVRAAPRSALLTQRAVAFLLFSVLVQVPLALYYFVFHGDWFLLYLTDASAIPSAVSLLCVFLLLGVGVVGFHVGGTLVRTQRDWWVLAVTGASFLTMLIVILVLRGRLGWVGTTEQFEGDYGLVGYRESSLFHGTILGVSVLLLGWSSLFYRFASRGKL